MTGLLRPPHWTRHADCDGHPLGPAHWDAETETARRICAGCPVRLQCALEALTQAIPAGMWGGLTTPERRTLAHTYGYDQPGSARHGDRSRYIAGCRCSDCREAHRRYVASRSHGRGHRPDTTQDRISA